MTATITRTTDPLNRLSPEAVEFWTGQDTTGMTARQLEAGYARYQRILTAEQAELRQWETLLGDADPEDVSQVIERAWNKWIDAEQRILDRNRRREARAAARR